MEKGSNRMNIDFFPVSEESKIYPPKPVKFNLPEWYKSLETLDFTSLDDFFSKHRYKTSDLNPHTVKKCVPVLDYLTSGYLLSFVSDVFVSPNESKDGIKGFSWNTPGSTTDVISDGHPHGQCPISINNSKHHYIKFGPSWAIKTPPGYSCLFYQPFYEFQSNFRLFPAIVDTDSFDSTINFPGYLTTNKSFMIKSGDPLMVVLPFKRDDWKMNIHNDLHNMKNTLFMRKLATKFFDVYKDVFHSKKRFD
jgi:hypothetical protein